MLMQRLLRKREGGFTLVELLIVIAIIAILAAIAIPQFTKYRLRGFKSGIDSDAKNIYTAAQAYLTDNTTATIDTLAEIKSGGYQKTTDINFGDGSMQLSSGNIEIISNALNAAAKDNNAVIFFNGKINSANQP